MKKILLAFVILGLATGTSAIAAEKLQADNAASKLARGATNIATCWGEYITQVPASVEKSPDYMTALFYHVLRGTVFTVRRAAVGVYDVVSFPFPGNNCYGPVIEPETIFTPTVEVLSN
ncbi:MAG TPA: exosortase system-associated protein, TIGR04073 family [Candidatus Omnitrophota bacterium]|nr:exosortase system-associated protein, TIGR04073 family [Candidatus Omnitrophota bacterium]